jgi:hypothetical protein
MLPFGREKFLSEGAEFCFRILRSSYWLRRAAFAGWDGSPPRIRRGTGQHGNRGREDPAAVRDNPIGDSSWPVGCTLDLILRQSQDLLDVSCESQGGILAAKLLG